MTRFRMVRCPGCGKRFSVRVGTRPACLECNTAVRHVRDHRGRIIRSYNRRGQLTYLAASASRLEQFGTEPGRALAPIDSYPSINGGRL